MMEKMDFADGKYTVINDNGKLTALRYGEPWARDLAGDNLVYWMLVDSLRLKEQRDALLEALKTVEWHGGGSCWVVDADKIAAAIKAAEGGA